MSGKLPIIYSAHHASHNFGEYEKRILLNSEQRVRFSDYGTAETVPTNGIATFIAEYSRGIIDLNRAPDDSDLFPKEDFGKPKKHQIWKKGQELTDQEKVKVIKDIYENYHNKIENTVKMFNKPGLIIAWDNTAHKIIGTDEFGNPEQMKPIILSNRGAPESPFPDPATGEPTSCDPKLLLILAKQLQKLLAQNGLPNEIHFNDVFEGGYIAKHYNIFHYPKISKKYTIQSFQVEYDANLTHDQKTLQPNLKAMRALKNSFEEAISYVYKNNRF